MHGTAGDHICVEYVPQIVANTLVFELWLHLLLLIGARVLNNQMQLTNS